jgi:hypothetical protein
MLENKVNFIYGSEKPCDNNDLEKNMPNKPTIINVKIKIIRNLLFTI